VTLLLVLFDSTPKRLRITSNLRKRTEELGVEVDVLVQLVLSLKWRELFSTEPPIVELIGTGGEGDGLIWFQDHARSAAEVTFPAAIGGRVSNLPAT
jgi:hypothetical protein